MKVPYAVAPLLILTLAAAFGDACKSPAKPTPTMTGLVLSGLAAFTAKNQTSQLTATANFSDGATQNVTNSATWSSSNAAVASVSSTGLVTAVGHGNATISATYQGYMGTLAVTVTLKAEPELAASFTRLCKPYRARLQVTITEAGGSLGMTVTSVILTMKDIYGVVRAYKNYTVAELNAALGSNHFNAGQSKMLIYEATYPGGVDTEDSTAIVEMSIVDDVGNTKTVTLNVNVMHDGC